MFILAVAWASTDRTAGHGSFPPLQSSEKENKKIKLGPKISVLQCTYIRDFKKIFSKKERKKERKIVYFFNTALKHT